MPDGNFDLARFQHELLTSDPLVRDVWDSKYRLKRPDGSSDEPDVASTRRRVVNAVYAHDTEDAKQRAHDMVQRGLFIPAGRVNAGAGSGRAVTWVNCFVCETIQDSMPGIQRSIARGAFTMQQGGGIGTDFSPIRPHGALVGRTGSVSSGVIPFMDQQDAMCSSVISAGTRRGAMMGCLSDDHPDLWNPDQYETMRHPATGASMLRRPSFISAKRQPGRLTGFNVSVLVSDAFMHALVVDQDWDLGHHQPRADGQHVAVYDKPFPYDEIDIDNEMLMQPGRRQKGQPAPWYVYTRVKARRIWDDIMRSTYTYAEPGVLFIDTINKHNNLYYCEDIRATNPCFTGDTLVWTMHGARRFDELAESGKSVDVLTRLANGTLAYRTMTRPRLTQRGAKLVEIELRGSGRRAGSVTTLRVTPDHEFFLVSGERKRAADLRYNDRLDSAYRAVANQKGYIIIRGTSDTVMEHHLAAELKYGRRPDYPREHCHHGADGKSVNLPHNVEILPASLHNSRHMLGDNNPMRRFPERNHFNGRGSPGDENGRWRQDVDTADISALRDAGVTYAAIASRLGCSKAMVMQRLGYKRPNHTVLSVRVLEETADVYCGTVSAAGRFFVSLDVDRSEGVLVANCAEQPLPENGCCCLGSVNLAFMVRNPFSPDATFDLELLAQAVHVGVRFLDNVLDETGYPLEAQRIESQQKRRIGLGVTGWGDALVQLGMRYDDSPKMAGMVASTLRGASYRASVLLARQRGSFPLFDADKFLAGANVKQLPESIQKMIKQHGIRNGVLNTIAPNGTISVYTGNLSSGHEPVYSFEPSTRQVRQPDGSALSYPSIPYSYRLYEAMFGATPVDKLPDYFVGALDISAEAHLEQHAAWQEYIDSSLSKTINCPPEMEYDSFKSVYWEAYNLGCKGCTTYRPDPTSGRGSVLALAESPLTRPEPPEPPAQSAPLPAQPPGQSPATDISEVIAALHKLRQSGELQAEVSGGIMPAQRLVEGRRYRLKWPPTGDNWYITVTRCNGVPFEVFITTASAHNAEWVQALSRLLTAVLRRGGDVRFLVPELAAVHSSIGGGFIAEQRRYRPSIIAAIGGVLEEEFRTLGLLPAGEADQAPAARQPAASTAPASTVEVTVHQHGGADSCPECGASPLVHEQGCVRCLRCDYNKCG